MEMICLLNYDYKSQAIKDLVKADKEYGITLNKTIKGLEQLYNNRVIAVRLLKSIDSYIESIANSPRDFNTKIGKIKLNYKSFSSNLESIKALQTQQNNDIISLYKGEYSSLRQIVYTMSPTTNIALASAFSTNNANLAFSNLAGANSIHNSLSWLSSISPSVVPNPIGGISLIETVLGMVAINSSNKDIAQKAELSTKKIKTEKLRIEKVNVTVKSLNSETKTLATLLSRQYNKVKNFRKRDWTLFTQSELEEIVSLLNSSEVLSKIICKKI